jgi:protein O-mannosyl-transferase
VVESPCTKKSRTRTVIVLSLLLAALTLTSYLQVLSQPFFDYDDQVYVTSNSHVAGGLTGENIVWAFTSVDAANWHPVTWLSHLADVQCFGMNPHGHHLTSLVIHTLSALLLFLLLSRLTGSLGSSFFVAGLFALHPMHVESVAWIAERKDVLSAFFWFLTLLCYSEYARNPKRSLYLLTLFCFVLGLMSKPMLVTLPLVMLLIDCWPLGRYRQQAALDQLNLTGRVLALVKEKVPFFFFSLLSCLITLSAQYKGGAINSLKTVPFGLRVENALVAYLKYLGKTLWPHDLAFFYPLSLTIPLWQVVGSLFSLLLLSAAAIWCRRRYPFFAVGWFWFLITLVPVIGFVQVGLQSMADRYSYLPAVGLYVILAWGAPALAERWQLRGPILVLPGAVLLLTAAVVTWHQLGYWQDSVTVYRHALRVTKGNYLVNYNLGLLLANSGKPDEAITQYREALRIRPDDTPSHNNLGLTLAGKGDLDAAIGEFREALRLDPNYAEAHSNLGVALANKGDLDAAIHELRETVRISPNDLDAHGNLGYALASKGDLDAAIAQYREALRLNPGNQKAANNLSLALAKKGASAGVAQ